MSTVERNVADVSVRLAWPDDAPAIAEVLVRAWPDLYGALLPAGALPHDVEAVAAQWRDALADPGDRRNRLLVALTGNRVVGFVMTCPATDPDCDPETVGEVAELTVDPAERGRGHGSRLLQAAVDTMSGDHFTTAVSWCVSGDEALRSLVEGAGWGPDGAHRELDLDGSGEVRVRQVRLHTALG